ncbi:MAG TPA: hypothetical protein VGX25_04105 [Actinophytocola sp.]|uniref:hypothetical protein n=1 Tax=Actinophytocola sp. TaxID=1872138 RepID=UPI002DDD7E1C|nr:hypothetical protein [Actinophytocola sp.]HEV2778562.1 hypothetical protein [Actinophytocola sp.]
MSAEPRAVTLHMTLRQAVLLSQTATAGYRQIRDQTNSPHDVAAFLDVLHRLDEEVRTARALHPAATP